MAAKGQLVTLRLYDETTRHAAERDAKHYRHRGYSARLYKRRARVDGVEVRFSVMIVREKATKPKAKPLPPGKKYRSCKEHPGKGGSVECMECGDRISELNKLMTTAVFGGGS